MAEGKILVVDDDSSICKVISRVITGIGFSADTASSGEEALKILNAGAYDLIVLDIQMGAMDGFEVVERIRKSRKDIPIIILSANSEAYNKLYGLEIGADDYVTKPFDPMFLGAKIKAIIRRDKKIHVAAPLSAGGICYYPDTMRLFVDEKEVALSSKEHALLRLFLENKGRVLTKEYIYARIWGDAIVDENAIMVYVSRLRGKLEADAKKPRYILTVWGIGYKFSAEN